MAGGTDLWHPPCLSIDIRTMARMDPTRPRSMKSCRACRHEISEQAMACPRCRSPLPAREKWDGWGVEYKSEMTLFGLPLLHISFKYRPNLLPVPARGIIAVGQFRLRRPHPVAVRNRRGQPQPVHNCRIRFGSVRDRLFPDRPDGVVDP